ncbi:MAG: STAS/SEC14 domain-containing protein [Saprospiraceae bacterium]|nr:STAS/SEC14 domain-containing protein [Saprospiraceae bacterium]
MEATNVKTRAAHFTVLEEDIVQIIWNAKRLELEDCSMSMANIHLYTKQRPLYYISDITAVKGMSKEARDYFKSSDFQSKTQGIALIVDDGISKITANFFMSSLKKSCPIKTFTQEDAALAWLISLKNTI